MYTLADVYKTFPSGCTEDYKILRAFEMGKQEGGAKVKELEAHIEKMKRCSICKYSSNLGYCKIRCNGGECNKMDKWELAD